MALRSRRRSRSEACCKEFISSRRSDALCVEQMALELVPMTYPVMPVGNGFVGGLVIDQRHQLGQKARQAFAWDNVPTPHTSMSVAHACSGAIPSTSSLSPR